MTIAIRFWENVIDCGAAPAFLLRSHGQTKQLSWRDVGFAAAQWIQHLSVAQVAPGQHVATWLPNSLHWLAIDLACQTLGCVHVAIDRREPDVRMRAIATQSEAVYAIIDSDFCEGVLETRLDDSAFGVETLLQLARRARGTQPVQMLATSGTSGNGKLVVLSHDNLLGNAMAKLDAAPQCADDLRLNILPWTHAYARTCELSTWILSRSRLAVADDWNDWLGLAESLQPTLVNLVPYLARSLANTLDNDPPCRIGGSLRLLQVGGAGLDAEVWHRLAARGLPPLQGYGLTEASPVVCSNRAGTQQFNNVGAAVQNVQLHVDDEGVLWTKSPYVMLEYWRDQEATQQAIHNGWLNTGDLVELRANELHVVGRKNQQIVLSTGYKVCPLEIEQRLLKLDWLEQAVVFASSSGSQLVCALWPNLSAIPTEFFDSDDHSIESLDRTRWLRGLAEQLLPLFADVPGHAVPRDLRILRAPLTQQAGTLTVKNAPRRANVPSLPTWPCDER